MSNDPCPRPRERKKLASGHTARAWGTRISWGWPQGQSPGWGERELEVCLAPYKSTSITNSREPGVADGGHGGPPKPSGVPPAPSPTPRWPDRLGAPRPHRTELRKGWADSTVSAGPGCPTRPAELMPQDTAESLLPSLLPPLWLPPKVLGRNFQPRSAQRPLDWGFSSRWKQQGASLRPRSEGLVSGRPRYPGSGSPPPVVPRVPGWPWLLGDRRPAGGVGLGTS